MGRFLLWDALIDTQIVPTTKEMASVHDPERELVLCDR